MTGLKQPALGILATALVIVFSLAFISLFDFPMFSGWVATFLLCTIPMEIVIGVTWALKQPRFAADRSQPVRGIVYSLIALLSGAIVLLALWTGIGGRISPPTPMLTHWIIASVAVTFFAAIVWGGWPFTTLFSNRIVAGLALMVACYVINYILFRIFFNYEFMQDAPVYAPQQDPHGMFNAWNILVFFISALSVMFLVLCFDLWPFTRSPSLMKQPVLGILWTAITLVIGGGAFYIGVIAMKMDPVAFLVQVPIPFIFGTIFILNMLQGSLFVKLTQPLKGVLNMLAAAVLGNLFAFMYRQFAPVVTGKLETGPPAYQSEIWIASALLSVTFPFLVAFADFFTMWPLQRAKAEQARETANSR